MPGREGSSLMRKLRARLHLHGAGLEEGTCVDTRTSGDTHGQLALPLTTACPQPGTLPSQPWFHHL